MLTITSAAESTDNGSVILKFVNIKILAISLAHSKLKDQFGGQYMVWMITKVIVLNQRHCVAFHSYRMGSGESVNEVARLHNTSH